MSWLPVGALDLEERGPYSARDEDEMIELIDLMHSEYRLFADKRGMRSVTFYPSGHTHQLVDERNFARQVEGPAPTGEWVCDKPLYTREWYAARDELLAREAEDGTNEKTEAMIAQFYRNLDRDRAAAWKAHP